MTSDTKIKLGDTQLKLSASLDQLNAAWKSVNDSIRELQLPIEAWVCVDFSDDGTYETFLVWKKYAREWQVCYRVVHEYQLGDDDCSVDPILSCTADVRLKALDWLPVFFEGLLEQSAKFAEKATQKAAEVSQRLERFKAELK